MTQWPKDNDAALDAFYGRPDGSAQWEVTHLTYIFPPWKCYLAGTDVELSRGIRVHKKVAESLMRIFADLWENICEKKQVYAEVLGLDQMGGAYFFRARRGSKRLSNHARGIAIDIDPARNAMKPGNRGVIDTRTVMAFEKEGWRWGGVFGDPMHFEAVDNGKPWTAKPPPGVKYIEKHISKPELSSSIDKPVSVQPVHTGMTEWVKISQPSIEGFEDFRAEPYWDFGQWSHGFGLKCEKNTPPITREKAREMLTAYLTAKAREIAPLIKVKITPNQGAALLSLVYNIGITNFSRSTLLKLLNSADKLGAAAQFHVWNKGTIGGVKKTLPGLINRRAAEKKLFLTP